MIRKFKSYKKTYIPAVLFMFLAISSCERDLSDEAILATFPTTAEVYTDNPVGLTQQFFESFDPAAGANPEAFGTDDNEAFLGTSSIRIDVPAPNDPNGSFVGGIFRDAGAGRDLSGYDALTFWAKGSTTANIDRVGFGTDFEANEFEVSRFGVQLSTDWRKYVIPIPDASKLTQERGMFLFSTGSDSNNGMGFTFWMDEIRFENLGTIGQPRPKIQNGEDIDQQAFLGISVVVSGLSQTFNLASGEEVEIVPSRAYYNFESTDNSVASVDNEGNISIIGTGSSVITGNIAGVQAEGSISLNVSGEFDFAPLPPQRNSEDVVSVFSDAYNNVPVDYFNGFFNGDGQTTLGGAPPLNLNGDEIINYTELNFVGIGTFFDVQPLDVSEMTTLHLDIKPNVPVESNYSLTIQLLNNVGPNQLSGQIELNASEFTQDVWSSFDIPISDFGLSDTSQIGLLFFISAPDTLEDIFVDNIYYYRE